MLIQSLKNVLYAAPIRSHATKEKKSFARIQQFALSWTPMVIMSIFYLVRVALYIIPLLRIDWPYLILSTIFKMKSKGQKFLLERKEISVHVHTAHDADALQTAIRIVKKDWNASTMKQWFQDVFRH